LGASAGERNQFKIGTSANETAFIATLVGGGGAAGTQNISIVPWAIGAVNSGTNGALTALDMGNSLVTYTAGTGIRPLDLVTEYDTIALAAATDNARESITADLTGLAGTTVNALVLNNNSVAANSWNVTGTGAGQTLAVTSGAMLFTLNSGAAVGNYGLTLGGFDSGITVGATNEYVIHVVNPDAGTPTKALSATISSNLTSSADITKSGRGELILSGTNTAGGGSNKTTLNEGALEIANLGNIGGVTGDLVFAGGTLRLGSGFVDDLSTRTISFLLGGATIDTNGIDLALANSVGSGQGGLTKIGLGNLTLNAAATYTGNTTVTTGTLTVGANNATGNGGNVSVGAGATLALGANNITAGLVTLSGASPALTGSGTITASTGFFFTNTGNITVDALLAGGGLFKNQTNVLTLTGANTYTGTTEVQSGTLSFDTISNVGGGASALGAPTTVEDGIIRMGLTTAATTLTYTGAGSTSDRIIEMQGTTGGVTLNSNGTGALNIGVVQTATSGNKTLTLAGTYTGADNSISSILEVGSVLTLQKTGAGTWQVNGVSTYTGNTNIDNGTLKIGLNDALPIGTTVRVGTGTTAGTFDLNGFDQSITSLLSQTNSISVTNELIVDAGNTLTVTGAVTIGANVAASTTLFSATGGGSFVNNNSGGTFQVGGATGATNTNAATADFSGLASFTLDLGTTGILRVGDNGTATSNAGSSTLILAADNTITAGTIQVASQGTNSTQTLRLGSSTNVLNANTLTVGGIARANAVLDFASATGTVVLRAADGSGRAAVNIGNSIFGTANSHTVTVDFTGHNADLFVSTLTIADRSLNTGSTTATFSFDEGTLDVTTLTMASRTSTGTGNATATVNLGDSAAPGIPTVTIGTLNMAVNTSAGGAVLADVNVTGGNVTIGTGSGTAINMANAGTGRTVTSNINLTGGTVDVTGNIIRTGGAGTENATITLDGSTLDLNGNSIGTDPAQIAFSAQSGRLENLGELNGGGGLTKTTAGVLILEGTNTYTGGTTISAGTVQIGSGGSSGTIGGGDILNNGLLAVDRDNGYTLANEISGSGAFEQNGTGTTTLTAANDYAGTTTVNEGILLIDGNQAGAIGDLTVKSGATLGGTGTIGNLADTDTLIENGGRLTAGTVEGGVPVEGNLGTLTFNGDLTLESSTSIWLVDLVEGTSADRVNVGGLLTLNNATLTINFGGTFVENQVYTIATYGTGLVSDPFLSGTFNGLSEGATIGSYTLSYGNGLSGGAITLTAVPEPGTLGFLGLALAGFVTRRIRRRRAAVAAVSQIQE